jgi:hypothetical protein
MSLGRHSVATGTATFASAVVAIEFFVAVPSEEAGNDVGIRARALGFATSVEKDTETGAWTCYCRATIVPAYDRVVDIERQLDRIARLYGGRADGFGSYGNASKSS